MLANRPFFLVSAQQFLVFSMQERWHFMKVKRLLAHKYIRPDIFNPRKITYYHDTLRQNLWGSWYEKCRNL